MFDAWRKSYILHYFLEEFLLGIRLMRGLSCQHFEKDHSDRIEIRFVTVKVAFQGLRSHIERSPHVHPVFETETRSGGKPEIRDLPLIPHSQDICRFNVPVDNTLSQQILVGLNELINYFNCMTFWQSFLLGDVLIEIPMRTVLHDQVIVMRCLDHLYKFHDVIVTEALVHLNFIFQHIEVAPFEFFQVDCLDCDSSMRSPDLYTFIDLATVSFSQLVLGVILKPTHSHLGVCHGSSFLAC